MTLVEAIVVSSVFLFLFIGVWFGLWIGGGFGLGLGTVLGFSTYTNFISSATDEAIRFGPDPNLRVVWGFLEGAFAVVLFGPVIPHPLPLTAANLLVGGLSGVVGSCLGVPLGTVLGRWLRGRWKR